MVYYVDSTIHCRSFLILPATIYSHCEAGRGKCVRRPRRPFSGKRNCGGSSSNSHIRFESKSYSVLFIVAQSKLKIQNSQNAWASKVIRVGDTAGHYKDKISLGESPRSPGQD